MSNEINKNVIFKFKILSYQNSNYRVSTVLFRKKNAVFHVFIVASDLYCL